MQVRAFVVLIYEMRTAFIRGIYGEKDSGVVRLLNLPKFFPDKSASEDSEVQVRLQQLKCNEHTNEEEKTDTRRAVRSSLFFPRLRFLFALLRG